MSFVELMKRRRSRYQLADTLPISDKKLQEIVSGCILQAPSAFNVQSARVVLLLGGQHKKLWEIVMHCLRQIVPAGKFAPTEEKINAFAAAYGSILYLDDTVATGQLQEKFPDYAENFPVWAQQANGMLQFAIWTALAEAGVGASLQHYNPLIDEQVKKEFRLPATWQLIAQMPFGTSVGADSEKTYQPLTERFYIRK